MLIGVKSVELLNTKMESQCWNQNFRPSIVADQCKPFDEVRNFRPSIVADQCKPFDEVRNFVPSIIPDQCSLDDDVYM